MNLSQDQLKLPESANTGSKRLSQDSKKRNDELTKATSVIINSINEQGQKCSKYERYSDSTYFDPILISTQEPNSSSNSSSSSSSCAEPDVSSSSESNAALLRTEDENSECNKL